MRRKIIYGGHTGDYKHRIGLSEAARIKNYFGFGTKHRLEKDTRLVRYGINEFSVNEIYVQGYRPKYELVLTINHSRMIGDNGDLIMEMSAANIKKLIRNVNYILKTVFKLESQHGNNDFREWFIERFDDGFDVYLDDDPRGYIYLMNQSLYLPPRSKLKIYYPHDLYPFSSRAYQSVYFGNNSYTMNVYSKEHTILRKHPEIIRDEATHNLIRIERQCEQQYISNYMPKRLVTDLENEHNIVTMRQGLKNLIATFWGTDNYCEMNYALETALYQIIYGNNQYGILLNNDVRSGGRLKTKSNLTREIRDGFQALHVAPAYVDLSMQGTCFGITNDGGDDKYVIFPSLYNMIDAEYPDVPKRKKYGAFASPHFDKKRGDWRVSMTVHLQPASKGVPESASGASFDLCQERMFEKLRKFYQQNAKYGLSNDGIVLDINNFYKTLKSKDLKVKVKDFLGRNGEKYVENKSNITV